MIKRCSICIKTCFSFLIKKLGSRSGNGRWLRRLWRCRNYVNEFSCPLLIVIRESNTVTTVTMNKILLPSFHFKRYLTSAKHGVNTQYCSQNVGFVEIINWICCNKYYLLKRIQFIISTISQNCFWNSPSINRPAQAMVRNQIYVSYLKQLNCNLQTATLVNRTPPRVFSCECSENFQNSFFTEHLWRVGSKRWNVYLLICRKKKINLLCPHTQLQDVS